MLNDQSSLYTDLAGPGSVVAAQMAVEDFGGKVGETPVEIVSADHQNKADIGSNLARQWFDVDGVDMIVDVPNSGVALAVNEIVREKNKVFLISGAASSALTGDKCSPNTVHWTYDTWSLANGTGKAIVSTGGDSWFFITADYAFGHALEKDTAAVVEGNGGKVVGAVRHPLNNADFSSFLLQAQSSGAKIVGLANAGADTTNAIKQAAEFGIVAGGQNLAGLLIFLTDVHALGLQTAQGSDLHRVVLLGRQRCDAGFRQEVRGAQPRRPSDDDPCRRLRVGDLHYLKALAAMGADCDGKAVVDKMKELPTDDPLFGKGTIRADGRKIHDMYLFEVKKPEESKGPWDYYKLRATIPAAEAFRPLDKGGCPLVK